jgi:hypothetical protein
MEDITSEVADAFNEVRDLFPDGVRFFLLKRGGQTERFGVVREVTDGWFVNYNSYRDQTQFEIATSDTEMPDDAAQTSYLGYGVPSTDDQIDVYAINDAARDKISPVGPSATWKFFGVRDVSERFTIPDEYL